MRPPEHEYVVSVDSFSWLPGAPAAVGRLKRAGYAVAVVSNQRGVARGLVTPDTLAQIETRIQHDLSAESAAVDGFFYCPHDIDDACDCRKPAPGLLLRAAEELEIDRARSVMIGDTESDIDAGRAAGCATVLISQGPAAATSADHVAPDLATAVSWITRSDAPW